MIANDKKKKPAGEIAGEIAFSTLSLKMTAACQ